MSELQDRTDSAELIERNELLRIIHTLNRYNKTCPEWVEEVIRNAPLATDGKSKEEIVYLAAGFLKVAHEKDKTNDRIRNQNET